MYYHKMHTPATAWIYSTAFLDHDIRQPPSTALRSRYWRREISEVNDKNVSLSHLGTLADEIYASSGWTLRASHVSIKRLAERTGLSERTVSEGLRVLRRCGFLDVSHTYKKWHGLYVRGASYLYLKGFLGFLEYLTKQGSYLIAASAKLLRGIKSSIRNRGISDPPSGPEPPIRASKSEDENTPHG